MLGEGGPFVYNQRTRGSLLYCTGYLHVSPLLRRWVQRQVEAVLTDVQLRMVELRMALWFYNMMEANYAHYCVAASA